MISTLIIAMSFALNAAVYSGEDTIEGAIHVDITPSGFEVLGVLVPEMPATTLPVDAISDGYGGLIDQCWLGGYEYEISGLLIGIEFTDMTITPSAGYLDVQISLDISINDVVDPFYMYFEAECIGDDCDAWIDPFEVQVDTTIALEILDDAEGNAYLDATVGPLSLDFDLSADDISVEGCVMGTILDIIGLIGLDFMDLLRPAIGGAIDLAVADLLPELESTIEEAFLAATIAQEIDLLGTTLLVAIAPGDIAITSEGMRLSMDAMTSTPEANDCIAQWDDGTFEATHSSPPPLGHTTTGIDANYAAGLLMADEFGNQLLYTTWRAGLLCFTVDDDLGFPIDTAILGLLAGDAFKELFPVAKPMVIVTQPKRPPTLEFDGGNDINVLVDELGLNFMAELDHRKARVLGMDISVDAGVDLNFDGSTGDLGIAIDLGPDAISSSVVSNDFSPDATSTIEESFGSVFNGLVSGLVGDMLADISVAIPGFAGMGITDILLTPDGLENDWLGAYIWLGEVSYDSIGCAEGESGGCAGADGTSSGGDGGGCADAGGSSCDGGCTTGPRNQRRWLWLSFPCFLAAFRRRS